MIKTDQRANMIGSVWMIASMAAFAVEDSLLKIASKTVPLGQILLIFGFGGACVFAALALSRNESLFSADVLALPMRLRVVFEIIGRLFFILAVTLTPLSSSTAILQATPIVVVAGAAILFGEKVGWRRWLAIAIGLTGVLIVIQPGTDSFSTLSILAVVGMFGLAGRDLTSRAAPLSLSSLVLGFYGFMSVIAAGGLYALWDGRSFVMPSFVTSVYLLATIFFGVIAYNALMMAMRTGEVSAVTPFRYTRLLFGVALGVFVFDEQFDLSMAIGGALIVLSGLFIMWRSKAVTVTSPAD